MTQQIKLSEELRNFPDKAEAVNRRLYAICQMMTAADILMSEVEDILNDNGKYKYTIKREHSSLNSRIRAMMSEVWRAFGTQEKDDFWEDNVDLVDAIKVWSGLDHNYILSIRPRTEGTKYTMTINPAGDIFLRDENGWIITLPKAIAEKGGVINETYDKASASPKGIEVDVDLFIRDKNFTK